MVDGYTVVLWVGFGGRVPRSTARMGYNIRSRMSEFETFPAVVTHRLLDHCYQNAISASPVGNGKFVFANIHGSDVNNIIKNSGICDL